MATAIKASEIKAGNFLIENGGACFEVLEVKCFGKSVEVKCDVSMYFASFRVSQKVFTIPANKLVSVLA